MEKGGVKVLEAPTPQINPDVILVKVHYSFISYGRESTTISESRKSILQRSISQTKEKIDKIIGAVREKGITGTISFIKNSLNKPAELEYSCSGEVVAVGQRVRNISVGDFVACAGAGIESHAEFISVPKHMAVKISSKTNLKQASISAMGAIALQGVRRANIKLGEKVCVIGLGIIGQLTVQLAKLSGSTVYGIDVDESKLALAKKLGCDFIYNSSSTDLETEVLFNTEHYGVDSTIITASSDSGNLIQMAMEITRRKGKVVLVGDVKIDFSKNPFYEKEIDFLVSCSYGPGRYDTKYEHHGLDYPYSYVRWTENRNLRLFAELVQDKKLIIDPLITSEYNIDEIKTAYESLMQKKSSVSISFEKDKGTDIVIEPQPIAIATGRQQVTVAIIGADEFSRNNLIPLVAKIKGVNIRGIVDANATNSIIAAKLYGSTTYDNDYKKMLENENIDAVIIATQNNLHTEQAIDCLSAGKAVFVEKPAAISTAQLAQLKSFFSENKNSIYCVDFNCSFSPYILQIKDAIKQRSTPLIVHYRMNSGFLPIHSEQHGSRIVSEACHIFELFNFLTNSKPKEIFVNTIETNRDDISGKDNFAVQISFEDGSICSLIYTSMGNNKLGKERLELFFDGKTIVMDDFKELYGYGFAKSFNKTTKYPDNGQTQLLTQFIESVKQNKPSPISLDRIFSATKISLQTRERCER